MADDTPVTIHPLIPKAFRHFLPLAWAWSDSRHILTIPPLEAYLWLDSFCLGKVSASERHFLSDFFGFSVFVLGYHSYHRELGYRLFLIFFQPHHGRILGRISDCIYSTETNGFGFLV